MFEWVISSSVLILIILLLRTLFRGKMNPLLQYALWGIVLIRLLLPISFGSTAISAINIKNAIQQQPAVESFVDLGNEPIATQSYEDAYQHVVDQYQSEGMEIDQLDQESLDIIESEIRDTMEGPSLWEFLGKLLFWIWIAGVAVVSAAFIYTNIRFYNRICAAGADTEIRKDILPVRVAKDLDTPCIFGFFRPVIYITEEVTKDDTYLRHTIEHEYVHYLHRDHIWAVLRGICIALHWYNPLVWYAAVLSQRDGELACDDATIKRLGEAERAEYGRTLIHMTCRKKANVLITATTMNASAKGIKERIHMIARKPKMAAYTCVTILLICVVAIGCTFTGAGNKAQTIRPTDEQFIQFFTSYFGEGYPTGGRFEANYIAATDDYALVLYSGTGTELVLYAYRYENDSIEILSSARGKYKNNKGIMVNHLATEDGDLYFGTVTEPRGLWETLVLVGEDGNEITCQLKGTLGFLCEMETSLADFYVLKQSGAIATNMTEYLNRYGIVEVDFDQSDSPQILPSETTEPLETTEPTEAVRTWPYDDAIGSDSENPSVLTVEGIGGPIYQGKIKNKICIGVYLTKLGERPAYIIPENQANFLDVFKQAYLNGNKVDGVRYPNMRGWSIHYQGDDWYIMDDGSIWNLMDDEVLPAEIAADLVSLCENAVRSVGVPEPLRPENITQLRSATLQWQGSHTVTNAESLRILESILRNAKDYGCATSCPFGIYLTLEFMNGETKTVTIASDSCAVWMSEGKYYVYNEDYDSPWPRSKTLYEIFAPGIIYRTIRTDLSAVNADALMNTMMYLNWARYSECYGYEETMYLMRRFRSWIMEKPEERYGSALYCMDGLVDTYAQSYAAMLSELFEIDKAGFAWACLGNAPEAIEAQVLTCLADYWDLSVDEARRILSDAINSK